MKKPVTIKLSKNKKGRWYWSAISPNGKKFFGMLESDGFPSRSKAVRNFRSVATAFKAAKFKFA